MKNNGKINDKIRTNGSVPIVNGCFLQRWSLDFYCTDSVRRQIESP